MEVKDFCETILFGKTIEEKLTSFTGDPSGGYKPLVKVPSQPSRPDCLKIGGDHRQKSPFPKVSDMESDTVRGRVFHFFANHELLALELMALALLKFPESPLGFRLGILGTMAEEQQHLRLYLERMQALSVGFGEIEVNNFFWHCLSDMKSPLDYAVGMSMTLEQANLDYCLYYKKIFDTVGDKEGAAVLDTVYRDEISHVRHGVEWFDKLRPKGQSQWQAYTSSLKLPLSPRRAKGLCFEIEGRKKAGLTDDFIERLSLFSDRHNKSSILYLWNPDCQEQVLLGPGQKSKKTLAGLSLDLEYLPMVMTRPGDKLFCHRMPTEGFLKKARAAFFDIPEFVPVKEQKDSFFADLKEVRPFGWTPKTLSWQGLARGGDPKMTPSVLKKLYHKGEQRFLVDFMQKEFSFKGKLHPLSFAGGCYQKKGEILDTIKHYHQTYGLSTILKSVLGAHGRGQMRVFDGVLQEHETRFLDRNLSLHGQIVVEPYFARVHDFGVQMRISKEHLSTQVTRFFVDARHQYTGHVLQKPASLLGKKARRELYESLYLEDLASAGAQIGAKLRDLSFMGFAGWMLLLFV